MVREPNSTHLNLVSYTLFVFVYFCICVICVLFLFVCQVTSENQLTPTWTLCSCSCVSILLCENQLAPTWTWSPTLSWRLRTLERVRRHLGMRSPSSRSPVIVVVMSVPTLTLSKSDTRSRVSKANISNRFLSEMVTSTWYDEDMSSRMVVKGRAGKTTERCEIMLAWKSLL